MIHGSILQRRKLFIENMISYGSVNVKEMIRAYKAAYPTCKKDETARVGAYTLLQDVTIREAIDKGLQEREEMLQKARQKELDRIARQQVASEVQLDAKLSSIALGIHRKKRKVVAFDKDTKQFHVTTLEEDPDESAMVAASNLLFKRKGSFAEKKIRHEAGDSFIEAMKAISARKKTAEHE